VDAAEAQRFAEQWRAAAARGATCVGFAASLQVNPATIHVWRRKAEAALGVELPTMVGAPHVAARERAKRLRMGALPPLPSYTTAEQTVVNAGSIPEPLAAQRVANEPVPDLGTSVPDSGIPECRQIPQSADVLEQPVRGPHRKHYIIPDLQLKPGVPMDHLPWIGADIVRRKPDVVVLIGDVWDMHSLSSHDEPGSLAKEGARYEDDIKAGMDGLELMMRPVLDAIAASDWRPRMIYTEGNHENRIVRTINADPRYAGTIGPHHCNVERFGFERHNFLEVVTVDGISYSHYFQMAGSNRPIGGSMDNRLNKICGSFVQGHEQGLLQHRRPLPIGKTIHGIVCGSAYLHSEDYRGPQRNNEWRGTVVLHDVRNGGDCDPMPLTLQYMAREYGGVDLHDMLASKYPNIPRGWAA
jgi:transposase-like protein